MLITFRKNNKKKKYICKRKFLIICHYVKQQQKYKKMVMLSKITQKILSFTEKCEIDSFKKFTVMHYEDGYIVLKDENFMLYFIIKDKCYKEKIRIYPVFSLQEIKEALTTF